MEHHDPRENRGFESEELRVGGLRVDIKKINIRVGNLAEKV